MGLHYSLGSDEDCEAAEFLVEVESVLNAEGKSFALPRRWGSQFTVHIEDRIKHGSPVDLKLNEEDKLTSLKIGRQPLWCGITERMEGQQS